MSKLNYAADLQRRKFVKYTIHATSIWMVAGQTVITAKSTEAEVL